MNSTNTQTTTTTPSGAPKLSRYMARIEAKRLRRLHPHKLTRRATERRCSSASDKTRAMFAGDIHGTGGFMQLTYDIDAEDNDMTPAAIVRRNRIAMFAGDVPAGKVTL